MTNNSSEQDCISVLCTIYVILSIAYEKEQKLTQDFYCNLHFKRAVSSLLYFDSVYTIALAFE